MASPVFLGYEQWKANPFPIRAEDLFRDMPTEIWIQDWCTIKDELSGEQVPFKLYVERQWRGCKSPSQRDLCRWIDETRVGIGAKGRQLGWSEIFGKYVAKIFVSEKGAEIIIFSMNEEEAAHFMKRRIKPALLALPRLVDDNGNDLIIWPRMNLDGAFKIETPNLGTLATVMSSNPDAGSGRTTRLTLLDEAEKIPFAGASWTAVVPTISKNPRGQLFAISSGQKNGTWYKDKLKTVYDDKKRGGINPIDIFFMPWHADPTRDQAWYEAERKTYDNDVDMKAANPDTMEDLFLSKQGKVFPHFDPDNGGRHVWDFEEKLGLARLHAMDLYTAYDPGFVHPAAFLVAWYDKYADILYIADEIVVRQMEIAAVGHLIKDKVDLLPKAPKVNLADTALFKTGGVGGKKTEGQVLNQVTGLRFKGAAKADANGSRELLSRRLSEKKIVFHPRCQFTIQQMAGWLYDDKGVPVDKEDDTIDDLRYLCAEVWPDKKPDPPKPVNKDYDPNKPNPNQGRLLRRLESGEPAPALERFGYLRY